VSRAPIVPGVPRVVNRLPALLAERGITWGDLARRTLLPGALLSRLRAGGANPRLAIAERVAAALGVPVEAVWTLTGGRRR
jgi:transcriptional regulator with XRE-family HTH domain